MMRYLLPMILLAGPAMAHPGNTLHLHGAEGFWFAALAFAVGVALSAVPLMQAVRAKQ